jgi:hypothetical protein
MPSDYRDYLAQRAAMTGATVPSLIRLMIERELNQVAGHGQAA